MLKKEHDRLKKLAKQQIAVETLPPAIAAQEETVSMFLWSVIGGLIVGVIFLML